MTRKRTKMLQNIIECMPISSMRLGPVGVAGSTDCWKVGLLSFACSLAPSLAHHGCCLERPPLVRSVVGYGLALLSLLFHCEGRSPPPTAVRVGLSRVGLALPPRPPRLSLSLSLSLNENRKLAPLSLHYESDGRTDGMQGMAPTNCEGCCAPTGIAARTLTLWRRHWKSLELNAIKNSWLSQQSAIASTDWQRRGGGGGLLRFLLLSPPSPLLYVVQLSNAHSVLEEGRERGMREVSQQGRRRRKVLQ